MSDTNTYEPQQYSLVETVPALVLESDPVVQAIMADRGCTAAEAMALLCARLNAKYGGISCVSG